MSAALVRRLSEIPGVHAREDAARVVVEPVTEHDLIQAFTALRNAQTKVSLSLSRMTRMGPLNAQSLTVKADAGVLLNELEAHANANHLTLGPLSPLVMKLRVGEFLEGPYGGLRASTAGRLEPLSVCLRVVTPDALSTASHDSPRSATGPDLDALHLGGGRRFGVITQATVRLLPKPFTAQHAAFSFATASALTRALIAALQDGVMIASAQVERRAGRFLTTVLLEGSVESLERDLSTLGHRVTDMQGRGAAVFNGERPVDERALDWNEVRAELDGDRPLRLWRVSVDGVIAQGAVMGRPLATGEPVPLSAELEQVAHALDPFGVMRIVS